MAQGAALAAVLGFMNGLSPAEIAKIVGPDIPVSIVAPDHQLRGGPFETAHILAVAAQLETAVAHLAVDTPPSHLNQTFTAYQSASAELGAMVSCK
jgi:hypothetical protein